MEGSGIESEPTPNPPWSPYRATYRLGRLYLHLTHTYPQTVLNGHTDSTLTSGLRLQSIFQ